MMVSFKEKGKELTKAQILLDLYPDNDLCKTPGLNKCINSGEVANLVCFALIWVFEFED